MKQNYIYIFLFLFSFAGCEKESVIDNNIAYEEYTVIRGELSTGKVFTGVKITRTLPLDQEYLPAKAEIADADAYLRVNGVQIIPLHYSGEGIYKPQMELFIGEGNIYEFFAGIGEKKIYARTKAPGIPQIKSASFYNDSLLQMSIAPKQDEVYGGIWVVAQGNQIITEANDYFNIYKNNNADGYSRINILTKEIPSLYRNGSYSNLLYVQAVAYDNQYESYYKSKNLNQVTENIFGQGGGPVSWNVTGEKTIGLFIGSASSNIYKVQN